MPESLREHWDRQADAWAQFARRPGHDPFHDEFNWPAFLELLPPPPEGRVLDIGCGEGRGGTDLVRRGYRVVGVDFSPRMAEYARERHEALVADAAALPFADESFELVLAYMSLMNVDDPEAAVSEAARVLRPGGRFCVAILHPIFAAGRRVDGSLVIAGSYFEPEANVWESDREGIQVTFVDQGRPLERYARAFEEAGLLIERIREPHATTGIRSRIPFLLHLRMLKR